MILFSRIKLVIRIKSLIKLIPFFIITCYNKDAEIIDHINVNKDQRDFHKKDPRRDHWSLLEDSCIKINVDASR